ncbi:MAG TPA: dTDP-4-keto-6-deoxy-D-glucose epimerase [Sulfurimonas sp.]|nr:dTDP-4-keto-6-deoxy-D-glucose epimerase [Sulfurimonas sp.]
MKILSTSIEGVFTVETSLLPDNRGSFSRLFCERELGSAFGGRKVVQINKSITATPGTVRGIHYQNPPHAEMKLIRCTSGRVWDVAVDLRAGSSTFLQWHAEELTSENARMLVISEGCGHGFQVLEPDSELLYLHTAFYNPEFESGVMYNDPKLAITWPLPALDLSARDQKYPPISTDFTGIKV